MTQEALPAENIIGFREKALVSACATGGMLLFLVAYWALETYGPSSRVVFSDYLPLRDAGNYMLAAIVGAWLGVEGFRLLRPAMGYSGIRLMVGCLLGGSLGLVPGLVVFVALAFVPTAWIHPDVPLVSSLAVPTLGAWWGGIALFKQRDATRRRRRAWLPSSIAVFGILWLLIPQFGAFPKDGTLDERETWARRNIRQYVSLTHTIARIPLIAESVGRVTGIAPTSGDQHFTAGDMDGVAMSLVLEVVGEKGAGRLHVHCTIYEDTVYDWQPSIWTFNGTSTEITTVPNLFQRGSNPDQTERASLAQKRLLQKHTRPYPV